MSKLYIVGTPIGNLGDFSPRGQQTLKDVDFIAAEDTRVTQGLLSHFDIHTPIISYYQHNIATRGIEIVKRITEGEVCALVSDAGMPAISDPGEDLVRLCRDSHIPIEVVPGPTAVTTALALSGFPTRKFMFEGFLEGRDNEKRSQLSEVKKLKRTLVYYEAPHKLLVTLDLMLEILGDRQIAVCRELTKIYEEVLVFSLKNAIKHFESTPPRGEFVLIIEGAREEKLEQLTMEQAVFMVITRSMQGISLSAAAKEVAEITGYRKGALYKDAVQNMD